MIPSSTDRPVQAETSSAARLRAWLRSDVTLTLPGWAVVATAATAVLLVLAALD